ncbi:MAG TPA: hypothetical protein VJ798_12315 [Rhizomicrobium sp.]|nr:hypothetical protein [Rhizomicrobium sp.]
MPRFFFHVREGADVSRDTEGQELPDVEAARREAISTNREMLGERLLHGGPLNHRQIEIADETGHVVDTVSAQEVLFKHGKLQSYDDDVTKSASVNLPVK